MDYWILYKNDKVLEQVICEDGKAPNWCTEDAEAQEIQAVRLGDLASEIFNPNTGDWSVNPDHAAFLVDFDIGRTFIENRHIEKSIEAKLILAGYEFDGILKKEAELLNIPLIDLAQQVRTNSLENEAKELERRQIKKT